MPFPSEFEEREFEGPLYNELSWLGMSWSPGLVLEASLGFDACLRVARGDFWQATGYGTGFPVGVVPNDLRWRHLNFPGPRPVLPTFRANLFLQAKRAWQYVRVPSNLKALGCSSPFWWFDFDPEQHKTLHRVAATVGNRAHIAYSSTIFMRRLDLYSHLEARTVNQHCTYAPLSRLAGHDSWAYCKAGATGFACSDPVVVDDPPLLAQIEVLRARAPEDEPEAGDPLAALAADIARVCAARAGEGCVHSARVNSIVQRLAVRPDESAEELHLWGFLVVSAFATTFGLSWSALA